MNSVIDSKELERSERKSGAQISVEAEPRFSQNSICHVLFIIDQLCETGGAERVLLNTIRLLPKNRFRCSLITFKIDPGIPLFQDLPCPHFVLPLTNTYDRKAIGVARKIGKFIREEKVQIVHTFFETSDLWAGLISKISSRIMLVSSRRDMGILRSKKHNIGYRVLNRLFDLVLTVSEEVRRFSIEKDHLPPEKVITLYNGLDLSGISIADATSRRQRPVGIARAVPLIVTVGHVRRIKGIDVLVETAPKVLREFPDAVFLVIGRNSEPAHFRELELRIAELGIQANVRFMGESENIMSVLRMCDIFFLPSRSEGFSNALIEAMACGLPCVATRVGGNAEAVEEGRSGYLFESEDSEAAAARIISLLRDPELAQEMSVVGRQIVHERFTAGVMIERLIAYYDLGRKRN
jgi:L-malate glycosyltransferase